MKAEKYFEKHDYSKLTTAQESGQYIILKYVFVEGFAEQQNKELIECLDNIDEELTFLEDTIKGIDGDLITKMRAKIFKINKK